MRQVIHDTDIDPANDPVPVDGDENGMILLAHQVFDAVADRVDRDGITQLSAEVGRNRRILRGDFANANVSGGVQGSG